MTATDDYTEKNIVNITIAIEGEALVLINGERALDQPEGIDPKNIVNLTIDKEGDVLVTVNGEDFQYEEEDKP
jgi:hypothetical protein